MKKGIVVFRCHAHLGEKPATDRRRQRERDRDRDRWELNVPGCCGIDGGCVKVNTEFYQATKCPNVAMR